MSDKLQSGALAGSTSVRLPVLLTKTSDGTEMTGKLYSDVTASYWRQGGSRTAITPVTNTVGGSFVSGGFVEVDATNQPGLYQFDVPDAAFASGADWVIISVKVASAFVYHERINLTSNVINSGDPYAYTVANVGGHGAQLTAAPDTAGTTTLLSRLSAARAGYLDVLNGIVAAIWAAVVDSSGVTTLLTRLTTGRAGNLDNLDAAVSTRTKPADTQAAVTLVTTTTNLTNAPPDSSGVTTLLSRITAAVATATNLTALKTEVDGIAADYARRTGDYSTFAGGPVASVTGNVGGNVAGSVGSVASNVNTNANATETAIKAKTDNLPASPAQVSDIPTASANAAALLAATVDTVPLSTLLADLDSWLGGKASVTDNGDGTFTITPKRRDNTTPGRARTYNPTTGARS